VNRAGKKAAESTVYAEDTLASVQYKRPNIDDIRPLWPRERSALLEGYLPWIFRRSKVAGRLKFHGISSGVSSRGENYRAMIRADQDFAGA
jgi:hypothetical protein